MKFKVTSLFLQESERYPGYLQDFRAILTNVGDEDNHQAGTITLSLQDNGVSERTWIEQLTLGQEVNLDIEN